jgi:L-rhamnose mutarotase
MKQFGYTALLRDDPQLIAEYKEYHRHVWPEVLELNARRGVLGCKIFLLGRRLFMFLTAKDDFDLSNNLGPTPGQAPQVEKWDRLMREKYLQPVPESTTGEAWTMMDLICDS